MDGRKNNWVKITNIIFNAQRLQNILMINIFSYPHLVTVIQEPVVKESVREEEIAADNGEVEKLTEHKSAKINVVSEILSWL